MTLTKQGLDARGRTQRRSPILRVRTGCLTCRGRKKKCDEVKPVCTGCTRNQLTCRWPVRNDLPAHQRRAERPRPAQHDVGPEQTSLAADELASVHSFDDVLLAHGHHVRDVRPLRQHVQPFHPSEIHSLDACLQAGQTSDSDQQSAAPSPTRCSAPTAPQLVGGSETNAESSPQISDLGIAPNTAHDLVNSGWDHEGSTSRGLLGQPAVNMATTSGVQWITGSISGLPRLHARSMGLLRYYMARTALSMGNGSTDDNPFITQMVPLMFINNLVLQLVLAQTAAHEAVSGGGVLDVAQRDYADSLRLFQSAIDDYLAGREESPLWVTVGALIMCFTETTRGDIRGAIFDHLSATGPLLAQLILHPSLSTHVGLKDFVIEYYVYTGLISIISMDPAASVKAYIEPNLLAEAQRLATSGYTGQLCGSWLSLLLLIPDIHRFGRRALSATSMPPFPVFDDFATFSSLQNQINTFSPPEAAGKEVAMCTLIYKQAMHLYLLTCLDKWKQVSPGGPYDQQVEDSLKQAFGHLRLLGPTARMNTSLCWAIAVVGCCVKDEVRRAELRRYLDIVFQTIGLGNIQATAKLLDRVWQRTVSEQSPWIIYRVMQENNISISFA